MNHLVGLDVPDHTLALPLEEQKILSRFRDAHNARRPADAGVDPSPVFAIADASSLPKCGWRPLDDDTLHRFLCADRLHGELRPEVSLERLRNALQFRRDRRCDEILNVGISAAGGRPQGASLHRGASVSSLCSGTFSHDDRITFDLIRRDPSEHSLTSCSSTSTTTTTSTLPSSVVTPAQLERYQRLRVRVFLGLDKQGRPVMVERLGAFMSLGSQIHQIGSSEWINLYIWDLERHAVAMRRASLDTGRPIQKFVYLGDLEGILGSIVRGHIWSVIPLLKVLVQAVEDHYPEIVAKVIVFNVPRVAAVVWEAIKSFLDPVTVDKVQLFPGFPKQQILELMDESVLPLEYGGTNPIAYPKASKK